MKHNNQILIVGPKCLGDLFKIAAVSKEIQYILSNLPSLKYYIKIPLKSVQYNAALQGKSHVFIKLPRLEAEREKYLKLEKIQLLENTLENFPYIEQEGRRLRVSGGDKKDATLLKDLWGNAKKHANKVSYIHVFWAFISTYLLKQKNKNIKLPFPLFRNAGINIYNGSKHALHELIQEELRKRYEANRDNSQVKSKVISSISIQDIDKSKKLRDSWIQLPSSKDQVTMLFPEHVNGFASEEYITSGDIFVETINIIGQQALPFTIYFISNIGSSLYKVRDYFTSIYPGLKNNFVGVSTPPVEFLSDNAKMEAICKDIQEKKPDLIVSGMNSDVDVQFSTELLKQNINFGIYLGAGKAIDLNSDSDKRASILMAAWQLMNKAEKS